MKELIKSIFLRAGYHIGEVPRPNRELKQIPDWQFYQPFLHGQRMFSPWLGFGPFEGYCAVARERSLVTADRCWILWSLARQALSLDGDFWECGVYQGGTAAMFARFLKASGSQKKLHLFDTFKGMPCTLKGVDWHKEGDFADTSLESVRAYVGAEELCVYHQGLIPETFAGLETANIAFAHIDVDIYQSVMDCMNFIFPRLEPGGFMVFDDYGVPTCPGARKAVDEFFAGKKVVPLVLPTYQAVVFNPPRTDSK
jgi:O-methyltransferase